MRIVLVGPGALGCLLASLLAKAEGSADHQCILLDHNEERAATLNARGISYTWQDREQLVRLPVVSTPEAAGQADLIILCVKSYDVAASLRYCRPLLHQQTLVLFLQNGVSHLALVDQVGAATAAFGTTTEGANIQGQGQVRHGGRGLTQLGFLGPVPPDAMLRLEQTAAIFNASELKTRVTDDILSRLWTKLMVNVGINGLTAILDCPNGELLTRPGVLERMGALVGEAMTVAAAMDIYVPEDSLAITCDVCRKTATNISSMLQDIRAGRRTEIDAINGAVVAAGRRFNLATPANQALLAEIKALEGKPFTPLS